MVKYGYKVTTNFTGTPFTHLFSSKSRAKSFSVKTGFPVMKRKAKKRR